MAKFNLNDYIYDGESLHNFRALIRHIHSVIRPDVSDVWLSDFRYNEETDMISYWVERWEDKFTCDYCTRIDIPSKFVSTKMSDKAIKEQWLKLHPEEAEEKEVAINGFPSLNSTGRRCNPRGIRTVIRYHLLPATIADVPGAYSKETHEGLEYTFDGNVVDAVNAWLRENRHRILQGEMPVMEAYTEEAK